MSEIKAALCGMRIIVGVTDEFGVTVIPRDRERYAAVTLDIPVALPQQSRDLLQLVAEQRVIFRRGLRARARAGLVTDLSNSSSRSMRKPRRIARAWSEGARHQCLRCRDSPG